MAEQRMGKRKPKANIRKVALDPRAQEALEQNAVLRSMTAPVQRTKKINHNKGEVKVKDKYGTVETKPCKGSCDDCKMRFRCFTERGAVLTEEEWKEVDATRGTGKILSEWKEAILREMPYVDVKPYSHNIISIALGAIARGWSKTEANKTIDEYGLTNLGWHKEK